ncbi:MAG: hypothetical protein AAF871_11160 [Pseudomonadota bacterium]
MPQFEETFAGLKARLENPLVPFDPVEIRAGFLALSEDLPDAAAETRLFRELAILDAKSDHLACLDHGDRALAAQKVSGALSDEELYFLHLISGDVATMWEGGPRTRIHLDAALDLHGTLNRPFGEAYAIRRNLGVYAQGLGEARWGLDWFEPLLPEAEAQFGRESDQVTNLLILMGASAEHMGDIAAAEAFIRRRAERLLSANDPAKVLNGSTTLAEFHLRQGAKDKARGVFDEAIAQAQTSGNAEALASARSAKDKALPGLGTRMRAMFSQTGR